MIVFDVVSEERLPGLLAADLDCGFDELLKAFQRRLYSFALRLSCNPQDAEEITQDAFVRAYSALADFPPARIRALALRPWLYTITLNVFRNRVRTRRPESRSLDVLTEEDEGALPQADGDDRPEVAYATRERRALLAARLMALPEHFRIAVVLRHIEGLAYGEIAALLEQPEGTVKAHVHRGTLLLRDSLTPILSEVQ